MYIWLINPLTMIKHFQWHTNGLSFLLSILTIIHNPYHPFLRDQSFWLPHVMSQTWKIMELAHTFAAFPVTLIISLEDTELLAPAKCERTASFVRRRIDVVSEKWRKWGNGWKQNEMFRNMLSSNPLSAPSPEIHQSAELPTAQVGTATSTRFTCHRRINMVHTGPSICSATSEYPHFQQELMAGKSNVPNGVGLQMVTPVERRVLRPHFMVMFLLFLMG